MSGPATETIGSSTKDHARVVLLFLLLCVKWKDTHNPSAQAFYHVAVWKEF